MGLFELYLLKSTSLLSMLYMAYWLTIRNGSKYSLNRIFLLSSLVLSAIVPILSFIPKDIVSSNYNNILEPLVINTDFVPTTTAHSGNSLSILAIIYIGGTTYFCLRFFSNISRIFYLYNRFPKFKFNGFKAVILDTDQAPFTFFNLMFISRSDYESGDSREVIVHEKAHRDEYHSIDILLLEIMTIIQWFNPFLWAYRLSLKSEHEFIADNKVLKEGFDKLKYQKLLFEKTLGITNLNLANNFNYSLLKKRLRMMTRKKSNSTAKIKYLLSMPTMLLILIIFAVNHNSYGQKDNINSEVDVIAEYKDGGILGMRNFIQKNIMYPKSARDHNTSAIIYVQIDINEKGSVTDIRIVKSDIKENVIGEVVVLGYQSNKNAEVASKSVADLEAEAIRLMKLLDDFTPAQKNGKNVKSQLTFPLNFQIIEKED